MGWPTDAQIDQAAETLCRMAEVPGLARGRAMFDKDLSRVEWYSPAWCIDFEGEFGKVYARIPAPCIWDSRSELFDACHREVTDGLYDREAVAIRMLPAIFDHGKYDVAHEQAGYLTDDVARRNWEARIEEATR